jgi:predicted ATPase
MMECTCSAEGHEIRLVCVTGGPGAGKTALLEVIRRDFCRHVQILPEAASILFSGGFPRFPDDLGHRAAQRAIYHVELELERLARERGHAAVALCDRGTLDGLAYWPGDPASWFADLGTTRERELARYAAVLHLRTPPAGQGYNQSNPIRIETPEQALAIDRRIEAAWEGHPHRRFVLNTERFLDKLAAAVELVRTHVPPCCRASS